MNDFILKIREKIKTDKKILFIILCGIIGILMLAFAPTSSKKTNAKTEGAADIQNRMTREAENLLGTVDGVGKVKVYLTIEYLEKSEYAKNTEESVKEDSSQKKEQYVLTEQGSDNSGLLIKAYQPCVRGVAVSCEGGGSSLVRNEVIKLMCAVYGISTNKVWVSKMKNR